jgi:hypothetical protein
LTRRRRPAGLLSPQPATRTTPRATPTRTRAGLFSSPQRAQKRTPKIRDKRLKEVDPRPRRCATSADKARRGGPTKGPHNHTTQRRENNKETRQQSDTNTLSHTTQTTGRNQTNLWQLGCAQDKPRPALPSPGPGPLADGAGGGGERPNEYPKQKKNGERSPPPTKVPISLGGLLPSSRPPKGPQPGTQTPQVSLPPKGVTCGSRRTTTQHEAQQQHSTRNKKTQRPENRVVAAPLRWRAGTRLGV